ncbi:MAG: hypothetical protein A2474_00215 [Elusimicrobia bacterium RIFOXYC2_FULL_34_12]|nr:MAG: hypothetical protein A2474_00215 [Elusimicrobia bacterium RIFOXYC2_FULL_34_12]OGS38640.1 MAG: hypothetical protein A2551_06440 [Elusimicrobia bacterium RIFOXYD2_FULL_34_30]HAM39473.1 hypothetical protein [Elusimicrobiota bacterium]
MDIGLTLKQKRQELGISFDEISAKTLINTKYLDALENNRYSDIPTEVMLLGFLSNYSTYLGLNANELITEYKKEHPANVRTQITQIKLKDVPIPNKQMFKINIKYIIIIISVLLLFYGIYSLIHLGSEQKTEEVKISSTGEQAINKNILEVRTTEDVWVRIKEGENPIFEGILPPNTIKAFESTDEFKIRIGNMMGITLIFNGNPVELTKSKLVGEIKLP